jgi:hypothetical protein
MKTNKRVEIIKNKRNKTLPEKKKYKKKKKNKKNTNK